MGVHAEDFEKRDGRAVREEYHIGRHPVVGFVGRLTENKGITTLIAAMRQVWKTNSDVRLLIAGPAASFSTLDVLRLQRCR